ncbi:MAG: PAS domain S-box-containing protein [Patiriisocius sp.]|jgi:PAS domain S-box-containing protein
MYLFKILIIDDIKENIFALTTVLEKKLNFEIKGMTCTIEALRYLDKHTVDLILCDVQMPNIDGFEFVSMIRLRKKTTNIPVIFVSAHNKSDAFFQRAKDLGAIDYLVKPIDEEELVHRINTYYTFAMREHEKTKKLDVLNSAFVIANEQAQLIDGANAPIFGVDVQGKINEWNQQAAKITGYHDKEVMGHDLVAEFITDDYKVAVGDFLDKALKGEETINFEFSLVSKAGSRVDLLTNSTARIDATGKIYGVVGVAQNTTELNKIRCEQEAERKRASAQIVQASKLAMLGEMATSVAHELNQPLNVIRMAAGNIRRKISKGSADPEYLNYKLERIEGQTARAAAIIDHMRMFGREAKEKLSPIDPRTVVTNALELMGEQLRLDGIEIVSELAKNCTFVLGHSIQMEQVVLNLLTNARDAMAVRDGEKRITLRVFENDKGIQIISEDNGGGIPNEVLPRIFDPFYTTKKVGNGTGLGLSVSYGIVHDMNGAIDAENIDGGARFTITLPSVS